MWNVSRVLTRSQISPAEPKRSLATLVETPVEEGEGIPVERRRASAEQMREDASD